MKEDTEALEKRMTALKWLAEHQVDVGLPDGVPERSRMILAIQEHGSPVMRIPPRPVIKPALAKGETREAMADAMQGALARWPGWKPVGRPGRMESGHTSMPGFSRGTVR